MHPRHSPLLTVREHEDRRVRVYVSEEKGQGEYFEDGRGVSIMSVSIKPKLTQGKDPITDQMSPLLRVQHISKRKRVSLLPPPATDLQR